MVHTFSTMLPLGSVAPGFELIDVISGTKKTLAQIQSDKATVIMFICAHCPYVKHYNHEIAKLGNDYREKGVSIVAISSNDAASFPDDAPDKLREQAKTFNFNFPYLYDETQQIAKAYKAACTPDFFVFNNELKLVYRGQMDDSSPKNNIPVTGKDLRHAIDSILKGHPVSSHQLPSSGCNIKWKAGVNPF